MIRADVLQIGGSLAAADNEGAKRGPAELGGKAGDKIEMCQTLFMICRRLVW